MEKIILVTGSSGFIGTNLIDELLLLDYVIIGISKSYPLKKAGLQQFSNKKYIPIIVDIRDPEKVNDIFNKYSPNIVIHLAAQAIVGKSLQSPVQTYETNIEGTWNILEASRKSTSVKKIIVASSDKAYGNHQQLPYKENFSLNAVHPYDISKKITEELAISFYQTYGSPIVITRCGNTFGPYDLNFSRIVPETILSCLNNKDIVLRSNGKQTRCYIYVKDIVSAYIKIIQSQIDRIVGEVFNLGNKEAVSVLELVHKIKTLMENHQSNIIVNDTTKILEINHQSLDSQKAKDFFNWETKYNLDTALLETIEWYRNNKVLK